MLSSSAEGLAPATATGPTSPETRSPRIYAFGAVGLVVGASVIVLVAMAVPRGEPQEELETPRERLEQADPEMANLSDRRLHATARQVCNGLKDGSFSHRDDFIRFGQSINVSPTTAGALFDYSVEVECPEQN